MRHINVKLPDGTKTNILIRPHKEAMRRETFISRLERDKSCSLLYKEQRVEGLVNIYRYEGRFILTWEECPPGQQYDESTYTRDERHVFDSVVDVIAFVESQGRSVEDFHP